MAVAAFWDRRPWATRAEAVRLGMVTGGVIGLVLAGALRPEALAVAVAFSALSAGDLPRWCTSALRAAGAVCDYRFFR